MGQPLHAPQAASGAQSPKSGFEWTVPPGAGARQAAQSLAKAAQKNDLTVNANTLWLWLRASGDANKIKAGGYAFKDGETLRDAVAKMTNGQTTFKSLTIVEGRSFRQMLVDLQERDDLEVKTKGLSDDAIMKILGREGLHPEGRFFPSTYRFSRTDSDVDVLRQAMQTMDEKLAAAWAARASDSPLKSPDELLKLASIVEKETGQAGERAMVAGVFANRLRKGMRLQTDPTIIYGVSDAVGKPFSGNIRKSDLQADTPYNSYTRTGLPPTPISLPGMGAMLAAAQPAATDAIYFVARGDGTSQFSANLIEHNRAVNKYQRGQ